MKFLITFLRTDERGTIKEIYRTRQTFINIYALSLGGIFRSLKNEGFSDLMIETLKDCMILIEEESEE